MSREGSGRPIRLRHRARTRDRSLRNGRRASFARRGGDGPTRCAPASAGAGVVARSPRRDARAAIFVTDGPLGGPATNRRDERRGFDDGSRRHASARGGRSESTESGAAVRGAHDGVRDGDHRRRHDSVPQGCIRENARPRERDDRRRHFPLASPRAGALGGRSPYDRRSGPFRERAASCRDRADGQRAIAVASASLHPHDDRPDEGERDLLEPSADFRRLQPSLHDRTGGHAHPQARVHLIVAEHDRIRTRRRTGRACRARGEAAASASSRVRRVTSTTPALGSDPRERGPTCLRRR